MDTRIDLDLLDRYLAGACTVRERADVERWLAVDPRRSVVALKTRHSDGSPLIIGDSGTVWRRVFQRIHPELQRRGPAKRFVLQGLLKAQPLRRETWRFSSAWVACAALVCLAVSARYLWLRQDTSGRWTTYATANGQRARIELTDGTVVLLNVASRLQIPEHFGHGDRTVRLQGEAVFQVIHTAGSPFTVDVAGTRARVLGTEFDVRAYQSADVQVAVRSGRVLVDRAVLAANDIAHVTAGRQLFVARHQKLDAAFAFVSGRLVLADLPLRDAIAELDRWYDVDIHLADSTLGDLPVDAVLLNGSVGDLRQTLQTALDVRTGLHGRTLILYAR